MSNESEFRKDTNDYKYIPLIHILSTVASMDDDNDAEDTFMEDGRGTKILKKKKKI